MVDSDTPKSDPLWIDLAAIVAAAVLVCIPLWMPLIDVG